MEVLEVWTRHDARVFVARRRMRDGLLPSMERCILETGQVAKEGRVVVTGSPHQEQDGLRLRRKRDGCTRDCVVQWLVEVCW